MHFFFFLSVQHFMPLASLRCSPDVHLFLCQAFVPECRDHTRVLRPCRELCERVRSDCGRDMLTFGISWPSELRCDRWDADCSSVLVINRAETAWWQQIIIMGYLGLWTSPLRTEKTHTFGKTLFVIIINVIVFRLFGFLKTPVDVMYTETLSQLKTNLSPL